jgi:hypothetical protein
MAKPIGQVAKELSILVGILVAAFFILDHTTSIFKPEQKPQVVINVPDKTEDIYDGTGGPEEPKVADLVTTTFQSKNVYDPKIYEEQSIKVAFKGEFEDAALHIEGTLSNDDLNFLYLGFGTVNGTYGADRLNVGQLRYDDGAAFNTKNNPLNISIDLMSDIKLSNSLRDVKQKFGTSKTRKLWDYIQPPADKKYGSIVKMVAGIYDENGEFGSQIDKIQIFYHCKDTDPNCQVGMCPRNVLGSVCLDNLFGKGAGDKYGKGIVELKKQ